MSCPTNEEEVACVEVEAGKGEKVTPHDDNHHSGEGDERTHGLPGPTTSLRKNPARTIVNIGMSARIRPASIVLV